MSKVISPSDVRGELALWGAFLQLGISDARSYLKRRKLGPVGEGPQAQAWRWIKEASPRPLGFAWACSLFGLDPVQVKEALRRQAEAD